MNQKITHFSFYVAAILFALGTSLAKAEWTDYVPPKTSGCVRKGPGKGIEARGDFKGDKKMIVAKVQIDKKLGKGRLAIWIDGEKSPPLVPYDWYGDEDNFVGVVEPGTIQTLCGRTGDCNEGDPKSITLKTQAITFGTCESSQEIYYWDSAEKKFKEVFLSD